jgi:Fic family protein
MEIDNKNKELKTTRLNLGSWYKRFDTYINEANYYVSSFNKLPENQKINFELNNFSQHEIYRMIFESNSIENAGTKTLGETKKIIIEENAEVNKKLNTSIKDKIFLEDISQSQFIFKYMNWFQHDYTNIEPKVLYKNKSKEAREVLQHLNAITQAKILLNNFDIDIQLYEQIKTDISSGLNQNEIKEKYPKYAPGYIIKLIDERPNLITQESIKLLHKTIAEDLLPDDVPVPAGEYRNYNNITIGDTGLVFPAAELLDDCMEEFCKNSNILINDLLDKKRSDVFYISAKISYDFVRIHPFGDFNGRISRILLNIILWIYNIPFPIALRGNKKEKHRYLYSLKSADNNNIIPYSALIAKRILETFQEFDKNIQIAGMNSILEFK